MKTESTAMHQVSSLKLNYEVVCFTIMGSRSLLKP